MAAVGERYRTEFTRREFTLKRRDEAHPNPGWHVELADGRIDWISDYQLSHCELIATPQKGAN
jgi:hypothetical protein